MTNTIDTLINEIQKELESTSKEVYSKYQLETRTLKELELKAYQELKDLGIDITVSNEYDYRDRGIILNGVLLFSFNRYSEFKYYRFTVLDGIARLHDSEIKAPNRISIGKATKSKLESWFNYAKQVIQRHKEKKEKIETKKAESLAKIESLISLPSVVSHSHTEDKSRGSISIPNFHLKYEIRESGELNETLTIRSSMNQKDGELFEKLALLDIH